MEKPPIGGFKPPEKNKMSRRDFLKNAILAAAAVGGGAVVSSLMERDLEKQGDGVTPEGRKTAEKLHNDIEQEKIMEEIDREKERNIYFGYNSLDDYLNDHPLVKQSPEELKKARDFFEKENNK